MSNKSNLSLEDIFTEQETVERTYLPVELPNGATLTEDQQGCIDTLMEIEDSIIELSGIPGSGKSFLIRHAVKTCAANGLKCIVAAPTGTAALQINGGTMHRLFGIGKNPTTGIEYSNPKTAVTYADVLIFDEMSMVSSEMFDLLFSTTEGIAEKRGKPFRYLLSGDLAQLPPVITDHSHKEFIKEKYGSVTYRDSNFYKTFCLSGRLYQAELTRSFRQDANDPLFKMLMDIREGKNIREHLHTFNSITRKRSKNSIVICATNKSVDEINQLLMEKLDSPEHIFRASEEGEPFSTKPAPTVLKIKVGMRSLITANIYDEGGGLVLTNGTLGIVTDVEEDGIWFQADGDSDSHEIERYTWEVTSPRIDRDRDLMAHDVVGTYTQFPIKGGYAITAHKSQGQTFKEVTVYCHDQFRSEGQLYVALSRCESLAGLGIIGTIQEQELKVMQPIYECNELLEELYGE